MPRRFSHRDGFLVVEIEQPHPIYRLRGVGMRVLSPGAEPIDAHAVRQPSIDLCAADILLLRDAELQGGHLFVLDGNAHTVDALFRISLSDAHFKCRFSGLRPG